MDRRTEGRELGGGKKRRELDGGKREEDSGLRG